MPRSVRGDIIDIFHRANTQNMKMVQGFIDGEETVIKEVNRKATQSAIVLVIMLILIVLLFWALFAFGQYLVSGLGEFIKNIFV